MSQQKSNAIHRVFREATHRLRIYMGQSGGTDATELADKCSDDLAERLHEMTCETLGVDPNLCSQRATGTDGRPKAHPWNRMSTVNRGRRKT